MQSSFEISPKYVFGVALDNEKLSRSPLGIHGQISDASSRLKDALGDFDIAMSMTLSPVDETTRVLVLFVAGKEDEGRVTEHVRGVVRSELQDLAFDGHEEPKWYRLVG